MSLEPDIPERIRSDFAPEDQAFALELLEQSKHHGRVARCIVVAARGSVERLSPTIDIANRDWRDAIMAGEYDVNLDRIRDLSSSFLIDSPEKFWISQVANTAARHDFYLIEICQLEAPHCRVRTAIFQGPVDTLTVEETNRKWRIVGEDERLKRFFMDRIFDHETEFCESLGSYLAVQPYSDRLPGHSKSNHCFRRGRGPSGSNRL